MLDGMEILYAQRHRLDFPDHTHDTFNIALILDQTFSVKLPGKVLHAPVGTLCITNPYEVHATPCEQILGNTFTTFYVAPDVLKSMNAGEAVFFDEKVIYDEWLFSQFLSLSHEALHTASHYESSILKCLALLVKKYANPVRFRSSELRLFREFLDEHSLQSFSLVDTAKKFGMDSFKFLRLFKQETGLTPNRYVLQKRIEAAKGLLLHADNLLEVAVLTGFYDVPHLTREFKKLVGVAPGVYRNS
ncbi:helix-turn-helix domain-containing protein [Sphingobacterium deserti]|uniref:Helix-turn-helix domain-containing protein n=2 Tax=Sphingobacterium deserti TaxID=1229276 RepID=A0A0B8T4D2_9SPHI|nr:helix-turn-helix domain-containing protein [Sphingobacterium deserti]